MKVDNNISFKGIKYYHIGSQAKERNFLSQAAKELKLEIDSLEKQGLGFDLVRRHDHECKPTEYIDLFLKHKPNYSTKDNLNPIQDLKMKINSVTDAKKLLSEGISRAKSFMKKHLEYKKEYYKT